MASRIVTAALLCVVVGAGVGGFLLWRSSARRSETPPAAPLPETPPAAPLQPDWRDQPVLRDAYPLDDGTVVVTQLETRENRKTCLVSLVGLDGKVRWVVQLPGALASSPFRARGAEPVCTVGGATPHQLLVAADVWDEKEQQVLYGRIVLERGSGLRLTTIAKRGDGTLTAQRLDDDSLLVLDGVGIRLFAPGAKEPRWERPDHCRTTRRTAYEFVVGRSHLHRGAMDCETLARADGRPLPTVTKRSPSTAWAAMPVAILPGGEQLLVRSGTWLEARAFPARSGHAAPVATLPIDSATDHAPSELLGTFDGALIVASWLDSEFAAPILITAIDPAPLRERWHARVGRWELPLLRRDLTIGSLSRFTAIGGSVELRNKWKDRPGRETRYTGVAMIDLRTGLGWVTPSRDLDSVKTFPTPRGTFVVLNTSEPPFGLLVARFDPDTGKLARAIVIKDGSSFGLGDTGGKRFSAIVGNHWHVLDGDTFTVVASSAPAAERTGLLSDGAARLQELLALPLAALP